MKYRFFKTSFFLAAAVAGSLTFSSCKKAFDLQPENLLTREQMYRNVFDADAAVVGLYGKFMKLAKPYILLNELRADLMTVTQNSDLYLQQLNNHSVTPDNPYIDPSPFYEVILNCNDIMKNFDIMREEKKLREAEYWSRYADVAAIRSFVYLQLGIHFGNVPYVTNPLVQVADLKDESNFPKLAFQDLVKELTKTMDAIPPAYMAPYPIGTSLVTTVDQYSTAKFFINKYVLLGDLHLWNAAYEEGSYRKAAEAYRKVISTEDANPNDNTRKNTYHMIGVIDVTTGNNLGVQYVRYRDSDVNAIYESNTEGWRSMFSRGKLSYDALWHYKWIWVLPFNSNFAPDNPFIDLFSNRGGGRYLVKPSQAAIQDWNNQIQQNEFPNDLRGRFTYKIIDGQPVIMKFLYYLLDGFSFNFAPNANGRTGDWFLYRDEMVWQRFGEAANREKYHRLAYAIVNHGIRTTYTPPGSGSNVTNIQQTFLPPPYNFDARSGDNPQFRADYRDMAGFRGRASLKVIPVTGDSLIQLENNLIEEAGRELAYEGVRWQDLLRVAIRRKDATFLTSKVAAKLRKEGLGAEATKVEGLSLDKLYLPFRWK